MSAAKWKYRSFILPLILTGCVCLTSSWISTTALAQGRGAALQTPAPSHGVFIREVRALELDQAGVQNPAGLAFSPGASVFHVMEAQGQGQPPTAETDIMTLTPLSDRVGAARITAAIDDPINMVFDSQFNRLLIFQSPNNTLIEVQEGPGGNLDPKALIRYDAQHFGLQNPQGMTIDPLSGHLFILDAAGPRIVRIEPGPDGSFDHALISVVNLTSTDLADPRGLALDPTTGHLHVVNPGEQELYELTQAGQVVGTRNLSAFGLDHSQGMVFAPSGDRTDDPAEMSLYIADSGFATVQQQPEEGQRLGEQATVENATREPYGAILELSFSELTAAATSTFTSELVNTVDMAAAPFSPPSPDPSGLAYLPGRDTLVMDDGEVEETVSGITHFEGANVWELTLSGSVMNTANISDVPPIEVPMTNEPTGVAFNPANGHYFFVQDDGDAVFELDSGADGWVTAGDPWTRFDLTSQNGDGEGIAYDSWHNHLFVADGVNAEVYEYTLAGSKVGQFDVGQYGVADPESVEFNPDTGTLFVMSSNRSSPVIVETTTSGDLLNTIDMSAAGARAAAGLAYAPASDGSGAMHFYIVDRGVDNNSDPNIVDGKMYELTAPISITEPVPPVANDDSASTTLDMPVNIDVAANDIDPNGNLDPTTTNNSCATCSDPAKGMLINNRDGTFTYTPDAGFTGSDGFIYEICDTDGLCDTAAVTIHIGLSTIEVRVAASSDDAEEAATGSVKLTSSDLELVQESSQQTVGIRFTGITMPQGAAIINAYVQFQTDEVNSETTNLIIEGEASDNAATFVSSSGDITSRPRTTASAAWSPSPWTTVGAADLDQRTSDISAVIQEIVTRPGWASGNALVLMISGSGKRVAEAYNGVAAAAPLLHVEYNASGSGNQRPTVTISDPADGSIFFEGNSITFSGTASDFEDGDLTASLSWESDLDGPIGSGGSFARSDLSVGVHTVTATVTDSGDQASSDRVMISIINNPPTAVDDAYTTDEDTTLNVAPGVLVNDSDVDGDPLTAILATPPSSGNLILNPDGSFTYTPNADFNGEDSFTYKANDGASDSNAATVSITVNPVNDSPTAVDDAYTTNEDTTLNVTVPGILANDSDVDGDPLTANLVNDVSNGALNLAADGSFTYTPALAFAGTDSFTYRANDGQADSNLVRVSITVIGEPISVTDIQPNTVAAGTTIDATIFGLSFVAGANVTFENGNGPAPAAANVVVASDGKSLTATIGAKSGGPPRNRVWDVRVTNPDGSTAFLAAGFTVTP
jgi:VCBS repeat-containing protein